MKTLLRTKLSKLILFGLIIAIALMFFNYRWSLGFLLGFAFSFITIQITESQIDSVLFYQKKGFRNYLGFILGNMVFIIPFLIAIFLNNYFDVIFVAFGLLFFKYYMFVSEIFFKKEGNK